MKFILMGGDERSARLCRLLRRDGHGAFPLFMEEALPEAGPARFTGADGIILPIPAERDGALNTPLSKLRLTAAEALAPVPEGTPVFAGGAGEALHRLCRERGLPLYDLLEREELALKNAALTAEGAVELMLRTGDRCLAGSSVLICGFGRIGRSLAQKLMGLSARVSVAARSEAQLALAETMGCRPMKLADYGGSFDFAANTVPAPVLGERELARLPGTVLLELASPPGGIDAVAAEKLGLRLIRAPGLPGKTAPESAAEAIRDTIYNILEG